MPHAMMPLSCFHRYYCYYAYGAYYAITRLPLLRFAPCYAYAADITPRFRRFFLLFTRELIRHMMLLRCCCRHRCYVMLCRCCLRYAIFAYIIAAMMLIMPPLPRLSPHCYAIADAIIARLR